MSFLICNLYKNLVKVELKEERKLGLPFWMEMVKVNV